MMSILQEPTVKGEDIHVNKSEQHLENAAMASRSVGHLSLSVEVVEGFTEEETFEQSLEGCLEVQSVAGMSNIARGLAHEEMHIRMTCMDLKR